MKNSLPRVGAMSLAAATIMTGLSFGSAAVAADPTQPNASDLPTLQSAAPHALVEAGSLPTGAFTAPFVLASADVAYTSVEADADGDGDLTFRGRTTAEAAATLASRFSFPGTDAAGPVSTTVGDTTMCLTLSEADGAEPTLATCDESAAQQFHWVSHENSFVRGSALARADAPTGRVLQEAAGRELIASSHPIGDVYPATALSEQIAPVADEVDETPVAVTNPTDPRAGYTPNAPFTFEGTGARGKTITIENKFGTFIARTTVDEATGTWSWTRASMGTSTWHLSFVQDKGLPTETVAKVLGFAPQAAASTPADPAVPAVPVSVTNPSDPRAGYTPNAPFTFEGTGTRGQTVTIENKFGTHIARTTVDPTTGTWSWTRASMGTSTWHLSFVQDKGLPTETVAKVLGFAPQR